MPATIQISSHPERTSRLTDRLSPLLRYDWWHERPQQPKLHNMSSLENFLYSLIGTSGAAALPPNERPSKAFAWARVSTGKQEERGLSMPEQLR